MLDLYEKLFDYYGERILRDGECYSLMEMERFLSTLGLPREAEIKTSDFISDRYFRWSTNAFALGLHLGLSLSCDNIRRPRPQESQ